MDILQKELIDNYNLYSKSLLLNGNKNFFNASISKRNDIDNIEQQIEEISLKTDFWKTSNLSISRNELNKKRII
ncbi:hypothetical protein BCR32DRAFT_324795, partial [Anaeromyces robustus]